jgi:deoxyribonuclease-4
MPPAADGLHFATAGVPDSTPQTSTLAALTHLKELGLDGLEMEFVRGVKIGPETAAKVRQKAEALGLRLSAHAPYYINLSSPEPGKRLQSQEHILRSARAASLCGARSVVFHAGYYGTATSEETRSVIGKGLREIISILKAERSPVTLRIETMGKRSQFGTLDETLTLCQEVEGLAPCLDFSHLHAREGKVNAYLDFHRVLSKVGKRLGREALRDLHIHISGIEYNLKGEIRHLNLPDSDFRFDEWLGALRDMNAAGLVVCESPAREIDAVMLKRLYTAMRLKS